MKIIINQRGVHSVLGFHVSEEELRDVSSLSGVLESSNNYITDEFKTKCEAVVSHPFDVKDYVEKYLLLKDVLDEP